MQGEKIFLKNSDTLHANLWFDESKTLVSFFRKKIIDHTQIFYYLKIFFLAKIFQKKSLNFIYSVLKDLYEDLFDDGI